MNLPRRVAIIQARMSSSRFPGKMLKPLRGVPLIEFMVRRVRKAALPAQIVVATSNDDTDDVLAAFCESLGVSCYRGSLDDVLDRFYRSAEQSRADQIVRLTGDCPLMDGDLIDRAIHELSVRDLDYVSNVRRPSYPDGLDVEAFTMTALRVAWRDSQLMSEREHVTPYFRDPRAGFKVGDFMAIADHSQFRWTIDHADDLMHVESMLATAGVTDPIKFDRFDLFRAIEKHGIPIGAGHSRNAGYLQSLANDPPSTSGAE